MSNKMPQIFKVIALWTNGIFIAISLFLSMFYLVADIGPSEAFMGFASILVLVLAAASVIAALSTTKQIAALFVLGYGAVCLFVGVAGWIWIEHFELYSQLSPPMETVLLGLLSAVDITALLTNRPIRIVSLLRHRVARYMLLGGVVITVCVVAQIATKYVPRISSQYASAEHFLQLGGGVQWEDGWVAGVYLKGTNTTDEDLGYLKDFPKLQSLYLSNTQVTDAGLVHISDQRSLAHLYLCETAITDKGLQQISSLTGLRNLWLSRTQVSDAGLKYLEGMTEIGYLDLGNTKVTDAGLAHLYDMKRMYYLGLPGTAVTESGLRKIGNVIPGLSAYNGTVSIGR
ncbi:hypothetical protein [Symmachiella dynata]|uniref:hypothetical protein n=1 Tax=Symmachiella dynata TaxID=2527995 RepID=UPI00119F841F|nr:hypothetical protein [Symmachiella dynata]